MRLLHRLAFLAAPALTCVMVAAPGYAQYMFLDTNGDSLNTPADVMNANGTATVAHVYLVTNRDRDGSAALCNESIETPLTINSYVVNLLASGGTVSYTGF